MKTYTIYIKGSGFAFTGLENVNKSHAEGAMFALKSLSNTAHEYVLKCDQTGETLDETTRFKVGYN